MKFPKTICLISVLPLILGTTYIIHEGGKEVGRWEENDGRKETKIIDMGPGQSASGAPKDFSKKPASQDLFRARTAWLDGPPGYDRAMKSLNGASGPLALYFYTTWCPYCEKMEKDVLYTEKVEAFLRSYARVRVNGDKDKALMKKYGVTGYPTFYVISKSGKKTRVSHDLTAEEFINQCKRAGLTG